MKALKRFANLVFVLCVLASAQQVQALSTSLYAQNEHNWWGSKDYTGPATTGTGTLSAHIDYAVYDSEGLDSQNAFVNSVKSVMPNMAKYLYAYQIFNQSEDNVSILSFAIFNLGQTTMNLSSQDISAMEADTASVGPDLDTSGLKENGTRVVWNFEGHLILKNEHSWFLLLSSDAAPVKGNYEIKSTAGSDFPSPSIPEPATIALLFSGAMMIAGRRKRK